MAKTMYYDVSKDKSDIVVVEGIRRLEDVECLQKSDNFFLVRIVSDEKVRYERLTQRKENSDDASKTFEQFIKDHSKETEITIPPVMAKADFEIENNGSREDLHKKLDDLILKLQNETQN